MTCGTTDPRIFEKALAPPRRFRSFAYGNANNPLLITALSGPDGRNVSLGYDDDEHLTDLTDVAGITSTFEYDAYEGSPITLATSYGTTSFEYPQICGLYGLVNRCVVITEPGGAKQVYALMENGVNVPGMPTNFSQVPDSPLDTLDDQTRIRRNSFYWDRRQSVGLPSCPGDFTWAEFRRARVRHWLLDAQALPGRTLALEQDPSPDGTTEGQLTWYDHDGKSSQTPEIESTQILPGAVARVMPDGTTAWTRFERNALGNVTRQIERWVENGQDKRRTNTFIYSADGVDLIEHRFGPAGGDHRVVGFSYSYGTNQPHLPAVMTNAVGELTSYNYDAEHRLWTVNTPAGLLSTYAYDPTSGYLSRVVDSIGGTPLRTNSYTWQYGQLRTHTDDRGLTVTYGWDFLGRLSSLTFPDTPTTTIEHRYTNGAGTMLLDRTAIKDRLGNWSYAVYNGLRQVTQVIDPLSRVTAFGYCDCGSPEYVTNAFGTSLQEVTHHVFDDQGRRTHSYFPDGTSVTNTYDLPGRLIVVGDAVGKTTNAFDNLNRLFAVSNAVGRVQAIAYDLEDRPVTVTDANGVTITSTFDDLGRLLTRTYPDTGVERFGYTAKGLVAHTNQISKVTLFDYDAALRKVAETNANLEVIRYQYKPSGDLWKLTDGKSQTTTWLYDQYGRVTNKVDQASVEILRYAYDANSRLTNRWSKAKLDTKYKYDAVGNLTNVDYNASTDIRLAYDALNRLTNMVDAAGTTAYKYYAGGLLWTEGGLWASDTVTNYYNAARMRSGLGLQQPTGAWTNGFTYDAGHRLAAVISPTGTFTYSYKGPGNLVTNLALPNTSRITNAFDTVGRLTSTRLLTSGNSLLDSYAYIYNFAGKGSVPAIGNRLVLGPHRGPALVRLTA